MQVGFDIMATVIRQLRIVIPVPQEEILQVQTICIRLGLIVILHLGNRILGCNLEIRKKALLLQSQTKRSGSTRAVTD